MLFRSGGVPTSGGGGDDHLLDVGSVVLDGLARTRDDAIAEAGGLLVRAGVVEESYVASMLEREASVSTAMGRSLAIPHGTAEGKAAIHRSGISFVRYAEPVEWNGKQVEFVIGVAGVGNEHLAMLGRIGQVFLDEDAVQRLRTATTAEEVRSVLVV